jgi:predicted metalloprotease
MNRLFALKNRAARIAAVVSITLAAPAAAHAAEMVPPASEPRRIQLTQADVDSSNAKVSMAYSELVSMWTEEFKQLNTSFDAPRLLRYRSALRTGCGVMAPSNAGYCLNDNTVYFDDIFVAAQAKLAGRALGTDGDMAAVGIIAHEMGHAVAMQLGFRSRDSYRNESVADCLAGAFARHAQSKGQLETGDIDEAFYGMAAAGDPDLTGDALVNRRVRAVVAREAHGTREQRTQNFRTGLEKGAGACMGELQGAA